MHQHQQQMLLGAVAQSQSAVATGSGTFGDATGVGQVETRLSILQALSPAQATVPTGDGLTLAAAVPSSDLLTPASIAAFGAHLSE